MVQFSHLYMTAGKTTALNAQNFVGKVMALIFSTLSSIVIAFLPRSKHLFISWLQSPFGVILELKKVKSTTVSAFPPSVRHAVMGPDAMVLGYQKMSFKSAFSLSFFTLIKRLVSSSISAIRVVLSAFLRLFLLPANLIPAWHFT